MGTIAPNATQGKALYEGSQAFYDHNDAGDPMSGGSYSHDEYIMSGTEAASWCDYFRYLNSVLQSGVSSLGVRNETGGTLSAGSLVYVSGYDAGESKALISAAATTSPSEAPQCVLASDISNNSNGVAYLAVEVTSIDTSGASAVGDMVYLSTTPGAWAYSAPADPNASHIVGVVTAKDAVSGSILFFPGIKNTTRINSGAIPSHSLTHEIMGSDEINTLALTSGTINGVVIGGVTPQAATFTDVTMPDSATTPPLNITARSAAPSAPSSKDIYLDDGTNTASGSPGWRQYNGATWDDIGAIAPGSGDVTGPGSSTDNAFPRFDGTGGKTLQGGQTTEDDSGNVTVAANLSVSGQEYSPTVTLTDGASIAWDLDSGNVAKVILEGNRTLANPTNMQDGGVYILRVIQDATGTRTLAYGANYKWSGGTVPTLTTAGDSVDILTFVSDGTYMYGVSQLDFQ